LFPERGARAMSTTCKRVHYSGDVQGVGFRQTARSQAEGFAVAGYVRNLPDGRVELVAEGETGEVERFLGAIQRRLAEYIVAQDFHEESPQGHRDFVIRY
jgi:acylphosphatase